MPYRFEYADKSKLEAVLTTCFRLFYDNMRKIASLGKFEDEFAAWYGEVYPAVKNTVREIVLMYDGEAFVGFFQYYVSGGVFMMEEIQFAKEYHGSGLFREFYTWLIGRLPEGIGTVRAYAYKGNLKSQGILYHLGLCECGESEDLLEYRGDYAALTAKYE